MSNRQKLHELIDSLPDDQLEDSYQRLLAMVDETLSDAEFRNALAEAAACSERLDLQTDIAALVREERDWHANRLPMT